jgi:hypothetical protein
MSSLKPTPTPSSPIPSSPASLTELAEVIHGAAGGTAPLIIAAELVPGGDPNITAFLPPPTVAHPAHPLVGRRVAERFGAVGLVAGGRLHRADEQGAPDASSGTSVLADHVTITSLADRQGGYVTILGDQDAAPRVMDSRPDGWVADALSRSLGLPTPAPEQSVAGWVDNQWLDALAGPVLRHPGRRWTWSRLLEAHPLADAMRAPAPAAVAARVRAFGVTHPWSWVREVRGQDAIVSGVDCPAELGGTVPAAEWFDDGSMCRWAGLSLVPSHVLLPDLLAVLAPGVADCLATALADTDLPEGWC